MQLNLYRNESGIPRLNAQRNLQGRTHYVDDATLRYHKSRVLVAHHEADGLLFYIIESYAVDPDNRRRLFRGVVFDIFGTVLATVDLDDGSPTRRGATKQLNAALQSIDAIAHTLKAIDRSERTYKQECDMMRAKVRGLRQKAAA